MPTVDADNKVGKWKGNRLCLVDAQSNMVRTSSHKLMGLHYRPTKS